MSSTNSPELIDLDGSQKSPGEDIGAVAAQDDGEKEALRTRLRELESKVNDLERALQLNDHEASPVLDFQKMRQHFGSVLLLLALILLATLPEYLVFRDRWLGNPVVDSPLADMWRNSSFLSQTALPPYFSLVFASLLGLLILGLSLVEAKRVIGVRSEFNLNTAQVESAVTLESIRYTRIFFGLAGGTYLLSILYGWLSGSFMPWGYCMAILFYGLGWAVHGISLDSVTRSWSKNWEWIVSFLIFHVTLILFMAELNLKTDSHWIYTLLLLLALANLGRYLRQIPPILWIINLALVLFLWNVNSWVFTVIGDDYGFYMKALEIAKTHSLSKIVSNLFNADGVYGSHPYFSSLLQAASMKLWGTGNFGWRFSSLYLSILAIFFFYQFYRIFLERDVSLLAAVFLATSSYIMTFGKVGYNNLQALFAMGLTLAAAGWSIHTRRWLAFVLLGMSMGLCLYVYPAALYILPLPLLLLAFYAPPVDRRSVLQWALVVASFGLLLWPLLSQPNYWTSKLPGLFINNPEIMAGNRIFEHILSNLLTSFLSFIYISSESHFVSSAYLDPISAVLVLFGMIYMLKQARYERFFVFFLSAFLVLLLLVGASHDRRFPPTTRMYLLLPWWTLLAAVGLKWMVEKIVSLGILRVSRTGLYSVAMLAVLGFNLYQAYPLSKIRSTGNQNIEALFLRTMERLQDFEPQTAIPKSVLFITTEDWGIEGFYWLIRAYELPASRVLLTRVVLENGGLPPYIARTISERNTLVIVQPNQDRLWQAGIDIQLESLGKQSCDIKEATLRDTRFVLWYSPGLEEVCGSDP